MHTLVATGLGFFTFSFSRETAAACLTWSTCTAGYTTPTLLEFSTGGSVSFPLPLQTILSSSHPGKENSFMVAAVSERGG